MWEKIRKKKKQVEKGGPPDKTTLWRLHFEMIQICSSVNRFLYIDDDQAENYIIDNGEKWHDTFFSEPFYESRGQLKRKTADVTWSDCVLKRYDGDG